MNRLAAAKTSPKKSAMSLFIPPPASRVEVVSTEIKQTQKSFDPFTYPVALEESDKPTIDTILENSDTQIRLGLAHDKALELLNNSVELLATKLDDVRADKLPAVITAASKVVEGIRRERAESAKLGKDREVHYHFYTPQQKTVADYEVIDVQ